MLAAVPPHVAGSEEVHRDWLTAHLGDGAFFTWQRLLACRNDKGVTWATRVGTAKHISHWVKSSATTKPYSEAAVKKHLEKLRAALLVKDLGWDVVVTEKDSLVRRLNRLVFGSVIKSKELFTIPLDAHVFLAAQGPLKYGGNRGKTGPQKGAKYKPRATKLKQPSNVQVYPTTADAQEGVTPGKLEHLKPQSSSLPGVQSSSLPAPNVQVYPPIKDTIQEHHSRVLFASQKEPGGGGAPPVPFQVSKEKPRGGEGVSTQNASTPLVSVEGVPPNSPATNPTTRPNLASAAFSNPNPLLPTDERPASNMGQPQLFTAKEALAASKARRLAPKPLLPEYQRNPPGLGQCGVPQWPSGLEYNWPAPPLASLRHLEPNDAGLLFMERWYNAAVSSRYLKAPPMRFGKKGVLRKYWELAVETCVKESIRPGSWVAFSIDEWRVDVPQKALKGPPDIKYVFGPRMQSRLWLYRELEGEYCPSKRQPLPEGESILRRLELVRQFARRVGWEEDKIKAEVARLFPLGFDREISAAQRTTQHTEAKLLHSLKAGKWIWARDYEGKKAKQLAARRGDATNGREEV